MSNIKIQIMYFRRPIPEGTTTKDSPVKIYKKDKTAPGLGHKTEAWTDNYKPSLNPEDRVVYTYEECAFIFDRVNFVCILIFEVILTVSYFSAIVVGGENSLD